MPATTRSSSTLAADAMVDTPLAMGPPDGPANESPREPNEDSKEKISSDKEPGDEFIHEYVNGITALIIIVPTTLVYFLLMLDGSIISVAIPAITSQFDSLLDIGW